MKLAPLVAGLLLSSAQLQAEDSANTTLQQLLQGLRVSSAPRALVEHRQVGLHAKSLQLSEYARGAAGYLAWRVDVFDAHQPAPAVAPGLQVAGDCGQQRTEMKVAGRGRRETAGRQKPVVTAPQPGWIP